MFSKRGRRYFFWARHIAFWELMTVGALFVLPLLFAPLINVANYSYGYDSSGNPPYQEYGSDHVSIWAWLWLHLHWFVQAYHDDIDALSTLVIASFTVVLAWSTVRLWQETERLAQGADDQSEKMAASIKEAARAAKAMERLADETQRALGYHVRPGSPAARY